MTMMDARTREGVLIGQIESLLKVRYYPPQPAVRARYKREFKKFEKWCDAQGLPVLPASGHTCAAFLLDLVFDGVPVADVEIAAQAIFYAHDLAQYYLDLAPMRAAIVFARQNSER
jgi:hypothetical protein